MNGNSVRDRLKELRAAWEREHRVDLHHWPIQIRTDTNGVVLIGQVADIAAKRLAAGLARQLFSDQQVVDTLRIVPSEIKGDGALRDAITSTLLSEPALAECAIRIMRAEAWEVVRESAGGARCHVGLDISEGVCRLSGVVGSLSHWRLVEVLAWWSVGCQSVDNALLVEPPEEDNDDEITDAVRIVLEKDPLVHASQLTVRTRDGEVTLHGYVASEQERRFAALDAWYVNGVRDVVNRIEVAS